MYSAALLFIWPAVLSHLSTMNLAIGLAVTLVVVARVIAEERLLRARYPEYGEYARSTKALVPLLCRRRNGIVVEHRLLLTDLRWAGQAVSRSLQRTPTDERATIRTWRREESR